MITVSFNVPTGYRKTVAAAVFAVVLSAMTSILIGVGFQEISADDQTWKHKSEQALKSLPPSTEEFTVAVQYYQVVGKSPSEIFDNLNRLGPVDDLGIRRHALTKWNIRWSWPFNYKTPLFEEVSTRTEVLVLLPQWTGIKNGPLAQSWYRYLNELIEHEIGHVAIVAQNYKGVTQKIRAAARTNPKLDFKLANKIAEIELRRIRALDLEYDRQTQHGKTQGVVFP